MIAFNKFSNIFKETGFSQEELRKFYYSVKKAVILRHVGRRSWPEIYKLEEKCQWPVLQVIDDPALSIYRDADPELLKRFIDNIAEEKKLRLHKRAIDKVRYWSSLQSIIDERIGLFTQIFGFCKRDTKYCETIAERFSRRMERKAEQRKKMWQIGIGTGAATLAGAAALWYISQKDKK
jgi:hypothetical protein